MTAPELKPCPFCGGEAERIDIGNDAFGNDGGSVIQCAKCMASSRVEFGFKENLIDAWNRRADLAAVQLAQVRVKPLVWDDGTNNRKYAKSEIGQYSAREFSIDNVRLDLDGKLLAGSFNTIKAAMIAAQANYEARIIAALEPQPDPRDEVIARLVEAADVTLHDIDDLVANSAGVAGLHMNGDVAEWETLLDGGAFGSWLASVEKLRAALAAAKAVLK